MQVVSLQGPTLAMGRAVVRSEPGQAIVDVPVHILGMPSLPVSADVQLSLSQVRSHARFDSRSVEALACECFGSVGIAGVPVSSQSKLEDHLEEVLARLHFGGLLHEVLAIATGTQLHVRSNVPGVTCSLCMPTQAGNTTQQTLDFRITSPPLFWSPADATPRNVTVVLPTGVDLTRAAVVAQLVNATNADIDEPQSASYITEVPAEHLVTTFTLQANQVRCYFALSLH